MQSTEESVENISCTRLIVSAASGEEKLKTEVGKQIVWFKCTFQGDEKVRNENES